MGLTRWGIYLEVNSNAADARYRFVPYLSLGSLSAHSQTFKAFRFHNGMTPEQAENAVPGYKLRWTHGQEVAFLISGEDIYANLGFCNNKLVSVIRSVDADTEFLNYLRDELKDYGQPKVTVRKDAWTGPGGGDITWIDFSWSKDRVGYALSLAPEGRSGSGELRYVRTASVHIFLEEYSCLKK